jgi:UDP-sulfoquinovose synthase
VHGKGGQTRGFLDIRDTVRCVELAALNPPAAGEFRVFNQFTEQFSILDLAKRVKHARAEHGLPTEIVHQANPRVELDTHYYNAKHQHLLDLGLHPHALADTLIEDVIAVVERHAGRVRAHTLITAVDWRKGGDGYGKPDELRLAGHSTAVAKVAVKEPASVAR